MFAAAPTNGGGSGFDGFDPRSGGSSAAAAPAVPTPVAAAGLTPAAAPAGGGGVFGQEFAGFSAVPAASQPLGTAGGTGGAVSHFLQNVRDHRFLKKRYMHSRKHYPFEIIPQSKGMVWCEILTLNGLAVAVW